MLKLIAALLLAALSSVASAATVIVIRHAERNAGMSPDVLLSPAGEQRAQLLTELFKDAKIQRIYVTEVRRVQQTAEPLAAKLHLKPIVIPAKDIDTLVSQLKSLGEDETVLVIGNSSTVPQTIERLGGGAVPPLADDEYNRLTIVVTQPNGKARVLTLRYGAASH